MKQLQTQWASRVDHSCPLAEYPRPQLRRESYLCLNGEWTCTMEGYTGPILVPYSPECLLSGVGRTLRPGQTLHYERCFTLPEGFHRGRVLLHFGAVDQECRAFVNGRSVGSHAGGNLAFTFDISDAMVPGQNTLALDVRDATEHAPYARGKQKLDKLKGRMSYLFYTPQSGIWKTVWLESVPEAWVRNVRITPLYDAGRARIDLECSGRADRLEVTVLDDGREVWRYDGTDTASVTAETGDFVPWTPDRPHLYDVVIRRGQDEVRSYFGMRKVSMEPDAAGVLRLCLNGKPYFFNGVLDQGYWPESLMTPPTDEALRYDILQLKTMGYNTIRKHIKVEDERFYYHCDRLGMMVWQDMPCGGDAYNMLFVTYLPNILPWIGRVVPDRWYRLFARRDEEGRRQFIGELGGMLDQLYSHPCIAVWTPFNEGWGQFDAAKATALIREKGGERLVNEACGWYDQGGGDLYSIHNYFHPLRVSPQKGRAVALTEYGGYAFEVADHVACRKKVGYKSYPTPDRMMADYERLWREQLIPAMRKGLCAAIYTQTSDIEEEINGLMTYDRAVTKFDPARMQAIHEQARRAFEAVVRP